MAERTKILELDINTEAVVAKSIYLKQQLGYLKGSIDDLKKAEGDNTEAIVKQEAAMKKLSGEYTMNQKVLQNLVDTNGDSIPIQQKANLLLDENITTIGRAKTSITEMTKLRDSLNVTNTEEAKIIAKLNDKIDENTDFQRENGTERERNILNIGNYTESVRDALNETGLFSGELQGLTSIGSSVVGVVNLLKNDFKDATDQIRNSADGTEGMSRTQKAATITTNILSGATRLFGLALIATGIGAIVVLFGALIAYLKSTQEGMDKATAVTRPLQAIFSSLLGVVQNLGKSLSEAFIKPKVLLQDFLNFLEGQVMNRFKSFKVILDAIANRDLSALGDGILQGVTGVENLTGKITNAAEKTSAFLKEAAAKGSEIDRLTKEIERDQLNYNRQLEKTNDLIDEQRLKSKDTSLSFPEREKAANEIIRLTTELGKQEENIIQKKIQQLKIQQSLNDTSREGEQEMIDLEGQLNSAQDRGIDAQIEQLKVIAGARKEAAAAAAAQRQAALTDAINKAKAELDYYISNQGIKAKSLQEELSIAEKVRDKKLLIAQKEFEATKKTETDRLNLLSKQNDIRNEFLQKQTDAAVGVASRELEEFVRMNDSKIDQQKFFSELSLQEEQRRLDLIAEKNLQFQDLQLERGVLNELEYLAAVDAIQEENRIKKAEAQVLRDQAEKDRRTIDLENQLAIDEEIFQGSLEIQLQRLDLRRTNELKTAEKTGADIELINKKYAVAKEALERQSAVNQLSMAQQTIGDISALAQGFFGENKLLAGALAAVDAILGAQKAFTTQLIPGDPTSLPRAIFAAAKAGAFGALNVAKVAGIKLAKGGRVWGPGSGTSDSIPADLSNGESVINAKSSSMFAPLLSAINVAGGGDAFSSSGLMYPSSVLHTFNAQNSNAIDYEKLAGMIGEKVGEANRSLPAQKLVLEEFEGAKQDYDNRIQGANF